MSGVEILLAATAAASATSALIAGGSAAAQAESQANSLEYQNQVAERNRVIALQNRDIETTQARQDAEDTRRSGKRQLSSIRAAYGASGVDLAGSPLDVLGDTATEIETDVSRIEYSGRLSARSRTLEMLGLADEQSLNSQEASAARARGKTAQTTSYLNAAASVTQGAADIKRTG